MSFYVIVRGPLGAGKTTVARALARSLGAKVVSIDLLLERYDWDGGSEALFLRTNRDAAELALSALGRGIPVILDGNFYWASAIRDLAKRLPVPHRVFSLRVPLPICQERDRQRRTSYGADATCQVFEKVRRVRRGLAIDATGPVDRTVELIRARLPKAWLRRGASVRPRRKGGAKATSRAGSTVAGRRP